MPRKPEEPGQRPTGWLPYLLVAGTLLLVFYLFQQQLTGEPAYSVAYSRFKVELQADNVDQVLFEERSVKGTLREAAAIGPGGARGKRFSTRLPPVDDPELLSLLERNGVEIRVSDTAAGRPWAVVLIGLLPWLLMILLFYWLFLRASRGLGDRFGGPAELKRFLETPAKIADVPKITFDDVAGQDNAKREVRELVEYLRHPENFRNVGADVPHGVLLMGAPGTGKTLLARALAGEAGVPFYSISGSEFIEVFVGVGASRVRKLFAAAKEHAPAIIFMDELDSVGRTRGTGLGGGHDEREQTLNQILAEMDGFEGHEAVIVLAATNRPDVLDPALLRPGRFDRHVTLDLPDRADRLAVLRLHTRNMPLAGDVDLEKIAAGTPGFSGADLRNLVNEAAILAARDKCEEVTMRHLDESRDKLMMGSVRTLVIQPEERHRLAVHEAGHTLVAYFAPHTDPLYKVTIIPRGQALGGTQQLPEVERHTLPEEYLRDRLAVIMGGRTAEKELLGSLSSGADDDIRQATSLARSMVSRWGMSEEVGPVDLRESEAHPFLGREIAQPRRYSEHSARAVDRAVRKLLSEAQNRALELMHAHRDGLERLIAELERHETLTQEDIEKCLAKDAGVPGERVDANSR